MKQYDLSILIPALREEFLNETIEDILKKKTGNTEVIVGLDGEWAFPGKEIADHEDVRIVYSAKNLGQRGITNLICKLSRAKYVAKCDAHVAFSEGFDTKLIEALAGHDDWTIAPAMKNLHAFDWICNHCGMRYYQGPEPTECRSETCYGETPSFDKKVIWLPRELGPEGNGPTSTAYRFTPDDLQFKYFGALKPYQQKENSEIVESMSLQGSFFMLTREKYWELNICDESWGGWGQQGTEVALKTWLSGGRVVIDTAVWYAHLFRTQSGFAFPWNIGKGESQGTQQHRARKICRDLFKNNNWPQQTRGLSWVLERFWEPLQKEGYQPDKGDRAWTQADLDAIKATEGRFSGQPTKGIIYYTDNRLNLKLAHHVQRSIRAAKLPIVSTSRKHMDNMGLNVRVKGEPGVLQMYNQILTALEHSTDDIIFFCEHDVLYHPSHFEFVPAAEDKFYYNVNWWKVWPDGSAAQWDAKQVSGLACYRQLALEHYKHRYQEALAGNVSRSYEPGGRDSDLFDTYMSRFPNIDVRHDGNLTRSHRKPEDAKDKLTVRNWLDSDIEHIPGWSAEQLKVLM